MMFWPLVFYDLFFFLLASLLMGGALVPAVLASVWLWNHLPHHLFLFCLPASGILFILALIFEIALIRLLLPKLREGYHKAPGSPHFYLWTFYLSLNRLIFLHPIKNIVLYSALLRFLALRALGAKVAFASSISADVDFVDLPMISIGEEAVIGACTLLTGHFINKDKLYLGPIKIGKKVTIGAHCHIAPNVEIGDHSWIGAECRIAPLVHIGSDCQVEPLSVIPPGTRLENGSGYPPKG